MERRVRLYKPLGFSDIGRRDLQQDCLYPRIDSLCADDKLFIICDGMGGHAHGEIASSLVANSFSRQFHSLKNSTFGTTEFQMFLETAWSELDTYYEPELTSRQMGTTLALLYISSDRYFAAHIGDSRIYQIRPDKITDIVYRSNDHTHVSKLLANGEILPMDAIKYERRNILNKAMIPLQRYDADIYESSDLQAGDYFMLCSDGVVENLTDEMIRFIFSPYRSPEEILELIHLHCLQLSSDNNSCLIIPVNDVCENADITQFPAANLCGNILWLDDELLRESMELLDK